MIDRNFLTVKFVQIGSSIASFCQDLRTRKTGSFNSAKSESKIKLLLPGFPSCFALSKIDSLTYFRGFLKKNRRKSGFLSSLNLLSIKMCPKKYNTLNFCQLRERRAIIDAGISSCCTAGIGLLDLLVVSQRKIGSERLA